jgi:hypothetical protein
MTKSAFVLAGVVAGGVAMAAAGQSAATDEEVIVWSAERRLTWDDFKARPPSGLLGGARSALGFGFAFGCRDGQLHARVVARFHPRQSWVAYRIISSGLASRAGLQHEQTHFDLAEVHARRIRRFFRELKDPCPRTDAELDALAEPLFRNESAAHRKYDDETENGQQGNRQAEWDKRIAAELSALAAFVDTGKAAAISRDALSPAAHHVWSSPPEGSIAGR